MIIKEKDLGNFSSSHLQVKNEVIEQISMDPQLQFLQFETRGRKPKASSEITDKEKKTIANCDDFQKIQQFCENLKLEQAAMDIVDYEYTNKNQADYEIENGDQFITEARLIDYFMSPHSANQQHSIPARNFLSTSIEEFDYLLNNIKIEKFGIKKIPAGSFVNLQLKPDEFPLNLKYIKEIPAEKRKAQRAEFKGQPFPIPKRKQSEFE